MTKRRSEGELGAALRDVPDLRTYVFRPPDPKTGAGVSNWKPADYLVWVKRGSDFSLSTWFEAKDVDATEAFPFADLRPSQLQGIRDAERMAIPYWLCVYWRRHRLWTISDAAKVLAWFTEEHLRLGGQEGSLMSMSPVKSVQRSLLASRFGVDSTPAQLSSTLKAVLLGEV